MFLKKSVPPTREQVNKLYSEYIDRVRKSPFYEEPWVIIDRLADVIISYVKGCVVEIGIGVSTAVLAKHAKKAGVKFYTCDSKETRCDWAKLNFPEIEVFHGKSHLFAKEFNDSPALVFIDGSHKFDTFMTDIDFFLGVLKVGGVMFLHDTCPVEYWYQNRLLERGYVDNRLVRKELEKRNNIERFTWPYTAGECGLTMILKKDMSAPEYRR